MNVADIMTQEIVSVTPDTPVNQIARLLVENGISGVPVVQNGKVIGIVTEEDLAIRDAEVDMPHFYGVFDSIVQAVRPHEQFDEEMHKILATRALDLMSEHFATVKADASIQAVATIMLKTGANPVVVVGTGGEPLGIVSRSDLVRLMVAEEDVELAQSNAGENS